MGPRDESWEVVLATLALQSDDVRDGSLEAFDPSGWNGAWRRLGWNFCWREGMGEPFPHSPDFLDGLPGRVRDYLLARGAPAEEASDVSEWVRPEYLEHRKWREDVRLSYEERKKRLGRPPMFRRPFQVVSELPALMRRPDGRGGSRDLVQFAKDWATQPADRMTMIADPPPAGTELGIACSIAAVVHALCDLDEMVPPEWVFEHRSPETMLVWGMQAFDGAKLRKKIISKSPPACEYHRVFFPRTFVEGPLWINPPYVRRRAEKTES